MTDVHIHVPAYRDWKTGIEMCRCGAICRDGHWISAAEWDRGTSAFLDEIRQDEQEQERR